MFHLLKRKILTLKNNREKQQQLQKKRARQCGSAWFYCFFFQNYNHIKAETADEAMFMSTREQILLEEVSRCSLYLR